MEEQRKKYLILGLLGFTLVGVLYWFVLREDPEMAAIRANAEQAGAPGPAGQQVASLQPVSAVPSNVGTVFVEADVDINQLIENIKEIDFVYADQHDTRNPLIPLVGTSALVYTSRGQLVRGAVGEENLLYEAQRKIVSGIIWDPENPLAVINDEVVGVGNYLGEGIMIKMITQDRVVLSVSTENENIEVIRELKEP
ncbi:MAG: hypothetical protein IID08_01760 [Candidatus Hydrogenedentes bacterium]|nr:hypothetical protein [Candidatus Hydrogenedentota bacterium]